MSNPPLTHTAAESGLPVQVLPGADDVGRSVGREIADALEAAARRGHGFVFGCPSGRSPEPVLDHLALEVARRDLDLRGLRVVMMDDYVVPRTGGFAAVDPKAGHSCRAFAQHSIVEPLNRAAGPDHGIPPEHVLFADPDDPAAFEDVLTGLGGIDLFLLATGARDGHVAFNPPGSPRESRTRIVELAETTRLDNLATFPSLERLDRVPGHGITVGIDTIAHHSRRAVMVAHGADKAPSVTRLLGARGYESDWPATIVVECREPSLVLDRAAAAHTH